MKTINTNGYTNIDKVEFEQFLTKEEKNTAVVEYFEAFENRNVKSNVIGYVLDDINNERIGYIEEHYVDSGSDDYYYTAVINN